MSLDEYLAIDLAQGTEAYEDLFKRLDKESSQSRIILSESCSEVPAKITPEMRVWYQRFIHGPRRKVLKSIEAKFKRIEGNKGKSGILLEAELDEIERKEYQKIRSELDKFKADPSVKSKYDAMVSTASKYQAACNQEGREAKKWNPLLYWAGIIGVILIEGLLNFESFTKIPKITPFYATGMTLATATFIGYAAHRHGIFIRQYGEEMGPHVGHKNKSTVVVREIFALVLLLVAMGIVAWGRNFLIMPMIDDCQIDPDGCEVTPWVQLALAMLGNIGVYIFGVLWSYWNHDPVPGFMELRLEKERTEQEYNKLYKKEITHRIRIHKAEAEKGKESFRRIDLAIQNMPGYQQARNDFHLFQKKDSEVLALLDHYRSELCHVIESNGVQTTFVMPDGFFKNDEISFDRDVEMRNLNVTEYKSEQLRLKYI